MASFKNVTALIPSLNVETETKTINNDVSGQNMNLETKTKKELDKITMENIKFWGNTTLISSLLFPNYFNLNNILGVPTKN